MEMAMLKINQWLCRMQPMEIAMERELKIQQWIWRMQPMEMAMERELEIHQLVWRVAKKKEMEHAANEDVEIEWVAMDGIGYLVPMLRRSNASEDLNVEDE